MSPEQPVSGVAGARAARLRISSPAADSSPTESGKPSVLVQAVHHFPEPSVEVARNGKGEPSWTLKLGIETGGDIESAADRLVRLDKVLQARLRPGG